MADPQPIPVAVVGLGGYADEIFRLLLDHPSFRVAACCDPDAGKRAVAADRLGTDGAVFDDLDSMLEGMDRDVRGVWLPVPIHLHVPFARKVLDAGRAVMLEKPVAGTVQEVDELADLAAAAAAGVGVSHPLTVGYQHVYQPAAHELKRRLLGGGIGDVESAVVRACWPRKHSYYARNDWAGALKRGGRWVLDSPANNALAHMINLAIFLLGPVPEEPATPVEVEAELYRANPIENFDTCALRVTLEGGAKLLILMTHAAAEAFGPTVEVAGSDGRAVWSSSGAGDAASPDIPVRFGDRHSMCDVWAAVLRRQTPAVAPATPASVRGQTVVVNAASEATPVREIASEWTEVVGTDDPLRAVRGIGEVFADCARLGKLPHELGTVSWAAPAGRLDTRNYRLFAGPAGRRT